MSSFYFRFFVIVFVLLGFVGFGNVVDSSHAWGNYHWARTANPFTLKLGDSVTTTWDNYLTTTSNDWSLSSVLNTLVVPSSVNAKTCKTTLGRANICNSKYGNNGWLGLASIWVSGSHIVQGTVKLNDTYFNTAKYNTSAWRNLVMCQEVGHMFGLDHQDEVFDNLNLGTCMDYTNDPNGAVKGQLNNEHPNQHDYDQLGFIYEHLDTLTTIFNTKSSASASVGNDIDTSNPSEWGKVIRKSDDGRSSLYERDLGKGNKVFTFVIWADSPAPVENH